MIYKIVFSISLELLKLFFASKLLRAKNNKTDSSGTCTSGTSSDKQTTLLQTLLLTHLNQVKQKQALIYRYLDRNQFKVRILNLVGMTLMLPMSVILWLILRFLSWRSNILKCFKTLCKCKTFLEVQ